MVEGNLFHMVIKKKTVKQKKKKQNKTKEMVEKVFIVTLWSNIVIFWIQWYINCIWIIFVWRFKFNRSYHVLVWSLLLLYFDFWSASFSLAKFTKLWKQDCALYSPNLLIAIDRKSNIQTVHLYAKCVAICFMQKINILMMSTAKGLLCTSVIKI